MVLNNNSNDISDGNNSSNELSVEVKALDESLLHKNPCGRYVLIAGKPNHIALANTIDAIIGDRVYKSCLIVSDYAEEGKRGMMDAIWMVKTGAHPKKCTWNSDEVRVALENNDPQKIRTLVIIDGIVSWRPKSETVELFWKSGRNAGIDILWRSDYDIPNDHLSFVKNLDIAVGYSSPLMKRDPQVLDNVVVTHVWGGIYGDALAGEMLRETTKVENTALVVEVGTMKREYFYWIPVKNDPDTQGRTDTSHQQPSPVPLLLADTSLLIVKNEHETRDHKDEDCIDKVSIKTEPNALDLMAGNNDSDDHITQKFLVTGIKHIEYGNDDDNNEGAIATDSTTTITGKKISTENTALDKKKGIVDGPIAAGKKPASNRGWETVSALVTNPISKPTTTKKNHENQSYGNTDSKESHSRVPLQRQNTDPMPPSVVNPIRQPLSVIPTTTVNGTYAPRVDHIGLPVLRVRPPPGYIDLDDPRNANMPMLFPDIPAIPARDETFYVSVYEANRAGHFFSRGDVFCNYKQGTVRDVGKHALKYASRNSTHKRSKPCVSVWSDEGTVLYDYCRVKALDGILWVTEAVLRGKQLHWKPERRVQYLAVYIE